MAMQLFCGHPIPPTGDPRWCSQCGYYREIVDRDTTVTVHLSAAEAEALREAVVSWLAQRILHGGGDDLWETMIRAGNRLGLAL